MYNEGEHTHCWFPPEQEQFLSGRHLVVINGDWTSTMDNAGFEKNKSD